MKRRQLWYTTEPTSKGVPRAMWDNTIIVPFNDAARSRRPSATTPARSRAVILEPVMMNVGIVVPQPRVPAGAADACERHGAVLIFDEVKCGGTIAYGGATERFGVRPHLAAWAKAIGGGATIGAFGGEAEIMEWVTKGAAQQGTFNGNPLSVGRRPGSTHPGAHAATPTTTSASSARCSPRDATAAIARHGIPAHTVDLGAKGCVSYRSGAAHELPGLPGDEPEIYWRLVPVDGEPRDLHDSRRRGAVDDLGAAHRGRHPDLRRRVRGVLPGARSYAAVAPSRSRHAPV